MREYPLTERVEEALRKAQEAARRLGHQYVGTEHILLGVLAEPSGELAVLLRTHGADPDAVPVIVERTVNRGKAMESHPRIRPHTSRAQQVLDAAADNAAGLHHGVVDLDQLLLALSANTKGIAAQVMADVGIEPEWIRTEVARRHRPAE
jgi:ATP-dependent Clp protease ATP-binding subunit ClpC